MIDFKIISKHLGLPWDFFYVSKNKTVTYDDFIQYPHIVWDYNIIQLDSEKRKWNAANVIKKHWKRAITDPERSLCRRKLIEDLGLLGNNICDYHSHT